MKIYFASDAHLGARFHKDPLAIEKKLVRWLDSIKEDASAIWFLGDLFDYWYEYKYVVPKGHVRFLGKLAELADRGIEIHIFIGNHDIWMFDYLPKEIGAIIHRDTLTVEYMVIFAKEYLKTHPDINFFIFGHRHIMLDLMLSRTSRILIAGDWMQFFSYIVWDGENLYMDQFLEETDGQSYPNT